MFERNAIPDVGEQNIAAGVGSSEYRALVSTEQLEKGCVALLPEL